VVRVVCPKCFSEYSVDPSHLGRTGHCTKCDTRFVLSPSPEAVTRTFRRSERRSAETSRGEDVEGAETWKIGDIILDIYEVKPLRPDKPFAEGGMGVVYRVHHHGWNIDLAVKSPKVSEFRSEEGKQSFERECEAWINLGLHPNIVTCYYVRRIGGIPRVFAEFVEGGTLWEWIRDRRLYEGGRQRSLQRILDIAIQFAWGLHHAHEQGLIHQDVKPENVLMQGEVPKVTDFGLARARWAATSAPSDSTKASLAVSWGGMTPAYCSPEQLQAAIQAESAVPVDDRVKLSRRTDIWSWALTVLAMFLGRTPCRFGGHTGAEVFETYRKQGPPERFLPKMPAGLIELLNRCFRKNPEERPRDMLEISDWLRQIYRETVGNRYPRQQPVAAELKADTLNNRAASLLDLGKLEEALRLFNLAWEEHLWQPQVTFNRGLLEWRYGRITDTEFVQQMEELCRTRPQSWEAFYALGLAQLERHEAQAALSAFEEAERLGGGGEVRAAIEQVRLLAPEAPRCLRSFAGQPPFVTGVFLGERQDRVLSGLDGRSLRLWEAATGRTLTTIEMPTLDGASNTSPDGRWQLRRRNGQTLIVQQSAMPDTAEVFRQVPWGAAGNILLPEGRHRLVVTDEGLIELRESQTGDLVRVFRGHTGPVRSLSVSRDVRWLLSGSSDKTLRLWEINTGRCLRTLRGHTDPITGVYLSPDARWALSCSTGRTLRLWYLGALTDPERRFVSPILLCYVTTSEEASRAQAQYADLVLNARMALANDRFAEALEFVRAARTLPGYRMTREAIELWNRVGSRCVRKYCRDGWCLQVLEGHAGEVRSVDVRSDYRWIASGGADATVRLWSTDSTEGSRRILVGHTDCVTVVRWSPSGRYVASAGWDKTIRIWDAESGEALRTLITGSPVSDLCWAPDGKLIYSAGWDRQVRSWEIETVQPVAVFRGAERHVHASTLTPDGSRLISAGEDPHLLVWDTQFPDRLQSLAGHNDWIMDVASSPDGRWAVSAGKDWTLRLWDLASGKCVRVFEGHEGQINSCCFTPDGRFLVSGGKDRTVRLWEVASAQCQRVFQGHAGAIWAVCVSSDGCRILSASEDETIRIWEVDWEYEFPGWADWHAQAQPYLEQFLRLRAKGISAGRIRPGQPLWSREDFLQLMQELQWRGFGWLRPEGVDSRLRELSRQVAPPRNA